ncbi:MAG: hypothetical protein HYR74_02490 [Candidatus Eisenbacteria bacterium]|nr:hypothetical protein [Candidatus Eisenbacteria bacterium]
MPPAGRFDGAVRLPPGLEVAAIARAIEYVEREMSDLVELYLEQTNVFSAVVGIFGAKALDAMSQYERHRNIDTMQQRFPDLKMRGSGPAPIPHHCLESKGSKRPWAIQSHYDHPGWYIVWRYLIDPTMTIEPGKSVLIWRVDIVFLEKSDWKYETSTAGSDGGGRTHTFGVIRAAAKLRSAAVYARTDIVVRGGKAIHRVVDQVELGV